MYKTRDRTPGLLDRGESSIHVGGSELAIVHRVTWFIQIWLLFFFVGWGYWMLALINMNIIALICCFFGGECFGLIGDVSVCYLQ